MSYSLINIQDKQLKGDIMLQNIYPDKYYNSIFNINLDKLKKENIKGIICDIDNTIVPYDEKIVKKDVKNWLEKVQKKGFKVCLISNGFKKRVKNFEKQLNIPAIGRAIKPRQKAFIKALDILKLKKEEIVVIGDQIFTDVWGGNRMGLKTILVDPLVKKDFIFTKFLRAAEKIFVKNKIENKPNT